MVSRCAILLLVCWTCAFSQRLYDPGRDSEAKQGADAAGKLATGDLWERMARNLDRLSREDINLYLLDHQLRMRATIDDLDTWEKADKLVEGIGRKLGVAGFVDAATVKEQADEFKKKRAELESEIKAASGAIAALKKNQSVVPEFLQPVFDNIGDIDAGVGKLKEFASSGPAGTVADRVADAVAVLKQIQSVFAAADSGIKAVNEKRAALGGLDLDVQRSLLLLLKADEEHLKNQMAILARRAEEERDLTLLVRDYKARRTPPMPQGNIPETLLQLRNGTTARVKAREQIYGQVRALYDAAALASRGDMPVSLQRLRLAQEEERYSIRKSAAQARAYEQLLNAGARRLALFYAGGVKPETVAQLVFNALSLANLGYLTYAK